MRTFEATMSIRGQVTVPAPLREALNLRPGDTVVFDQDETGRVGLRAEGGRTMPQASDPGDLSLMQAIARTARQSHRGRSIDDPIGDDLVAEDDRTKTRR